MKERDKRDSTDEEARELLDKLIAVIETSRDREDQDSISWRYEFWAEIRTNPLTPRIVIYLLRKLRQLTFVP